MMERLLDSQEQGFELEVEMIPTAIRAGYAIDWVPISTISCAIVAARALQSLVHGRLPTRLAAWSILRPRRYDSRMATKVLAACR